MELGVFRGSGIYAWLKMLNCLGSNKRVYGFDIFNSDKLLSGIGTKDRDVMSSLFQDRGFSPLGYHEVLRTKLVEHGFSDFELIAGDIFETLTRSIYICIGDRFQMVVLGDERILIS